MTALEQAIPATGARRACDALGEANVSTGISDRLANARGVWPVELKTMRRSDHRNEVTAGPPLPGCVVWPADTDEVSAVLRIAQRVAHPGRAVRRRFRDRRRHRSTARLHLARHQAARPAARRPDLAGRVRRGRDRRRRAGAAVERARLFAGPLPAIALLQHGRRLGGDAGLRHLLDAARQHRGPRRRSRSRAPRRRGAARAAESALRDRPESRRNLPRLRGRARRDHRGGALGAPAPREHRSGRATRFPRFTLGWTPSARSSRPARGRASSGSTTPAKRRTSSLRSVSA